MTPSTPLATTKLLPLAEVAEKLGRSANGTRVAASRLQVIAVKVDGKFFSHPALFARPTH